MTEYPPGWSCEVTALRLEQYVEATLPRRESIAVAEHLEACASCAERLEDVERPASRGAATATGRRRGAHD